MADTNWQDFPDSAPAATDILLALRGAGGVNFTAQQLAASVFALGSDGAGNVGIGTSSPAQKLDVYNGLIRVGGAVSGKLLGYSAANVQVMEVGVGTGTGSGADVGLWNGLSGNMVFGTSNAERARIDSNGNMGIGTTSPGYRLHVNGSFRVEGDSVIANARTFSYLNTSGAFGAYLVCQGDNNFVLYCRDSSGNAQPAMGVQTGAASGTGEFKIYGYCAKLVHAQDNYADLGSASARWKTVYAITGTINTSDERAKQNVTPIPDEWLDAWGNVDWGRYKFIDAVQAKGEDARWHLGLIAQKVRDAFAAHGLDAQEIGLLCYDQWEERREPIFEEQVIDRLPVVIRQEGTGVFGPDGAEIMRDVTEACDVLGQVQVGERVALEAGDRWGLRYDECQALEAAWQRRELARKDARIAAQDATIASLITRLEALEAAA